MKIGIWLLILAWLLEFGSWSLAAAMGGSPPAKKEPKYKLEILKMDVISGQAQTLQSTSESGEKPKYKLEILKMDIITTTSPSVESKTSPK